MDVENNYKVGKKIKTFLVFFCAMVLLGCLNEKRPVLVKLNFKDGKAISATFHYDESIEDLGIYVSGNPDVPVLGEFKSEENTYTFSPIAHFLDYQEYQILSKGKTIAKFKVEPTKIKSTPEVLIIYPSRDTVPVNLLKMYFVFSQPMQHIGDPTDFITVFDETDDKEVRPFLELENELWNKNHTRLTLWLDPGRIKTDLIPNKERGLPLQQGHMYRVAISRNWKSSQGMPLKQSYSKYFHVAPRDNAKPTPQEWTIVPPKKNTKHPLKIDFGEPMDAMLARESIMIYKADQNIKGSFDIIQKDEAIEFHPNTVWTAGTYTILINTVFEDLAGNNLNRLFDTEIKKETHASHITEQELSFIVN